MTWDIEFLEEAEKDIKSLIILSVSRFSKASGK